MIIDNGQWGPSSPLPTNLDNRSPSIPTSFRGKTGVAPYGWVPTFVRTRRHARTDIYSKSTGEFAGLSAFVDPETIVDYTNVQDLIFRETKNVSLYGRICECNNIIEGVEGSTSFTEEQKFKK